jgi:hypothetical protein
METPREMFFDATWISQNNREVLQWGQRRIQLLEQQIDAMEVHLHERNATIDELETEIKLSQTAFSKITGSTSQESDEDQHQRRREWMLDRITLICAHYGMRQMTGSPAGQRDAGQAFRDTAENICDGISKYDANQ